MKQYIQWHNDTFGEKVVKALEKNNFQAHYAVNRAAAIEKALSLIPAGATIGVGGSWTLKELGIPEQLAKNGHTVYDHSIPGLTMEESLALRRKELLSDVFLSSTNAITLDGQLVNTDGSGNRVAAMSFGPKKVIVIVGVNKIVSDLDAAMERIETVAAPINNKRLDRPNPCTITGMCMDCQGSTRICNITSILHKRPPAIDFHVIVVGEELGF
jgi:L-lactate utilization protein LutC